MEQEKKLILLYNYLLYVVYDGEREKTHSFKTLFFLSYLWWSKIKNSNSFCDNTIFFMLFMMEEEKKLILLMLSMMEQDQKLILLYNCFLYFVYIWIGEKTHSFKTLFFVSSLWWRKRKTANSSCYNIIFFILSMMKQKKKLILLSHYFLYLVYDGGKEKIHSVATWFFFSCLWLSKGKNWFGDNIIFCILSMIEQEKKLILL